MSFNGAAFLRTRNRSVRRPGAMPSGSFNGAAFLRTRNLPGEPCRSSDAGASMGPRSYERGILARSAGGVSSRAGFNGAAFLRTRNPAGVHPEVTTVTPLQWGRVLTNAESSSPICIIVRHPPLQWGRVLTNAESYLPGAPGAEKMRLQWGRVLTNAESFLV